MIANFIFVFIFLGFLIIAEGGFGFIFHPQLDSSRDFCFRIF